MNYFEKHLNVLHDQYKHDIAKERAENDQLRGDNVRVRGEWEQMRDKCLVLQVVLDAETARKQAQADAETTQKGAVILLDGARAENERLLTEYNQVYTKCVQLQEEADADQAQIHALIAACDTWVRRFKALEAKEASGAENERLRGNARCMTLQEELTADKVQMRRLIEERDLWASRFKALEADMTGTLSELNEARDKNERLQADLAEARAMNEQLQEESDADKAQMLRLVKERDNLQAMLTEARDKLDRLHDDNLALDTRVGELTAGAALMPEHIPVGTEVWLVNPSGNTIRRTEVLSVDVHVVSDDMYVYYNLGGEGQTPAERVYIDAQSAVEYTQKGK